MPSIIIEIAKEFFPKILHLWTDRVTITNEHFDRRIKVYKAIKNYIADVLVKGCVDNNAEAKFLNDTENVFFLFGDDIKKLVDDIFDKSTNLYTLEKMQSALTGCALENNLNKRQEIKDWFKATSKGLEKRFEKYLKL